MKKLLITILIYTFSIMPVQAEEKLYVMTLDAVSRLALENNFDVQLAKYDAWIAQAGEGKAKSIYDTVFTGEMKYRDNQRKQPTTFFGTKTQENDYNIGLSKKIPTGTTLSVDLTNEREATNSTFTTNPLIHDSTLQFTIEQELGKNFFGLQDRGSVKLTLVDIENSEYTTMNKLEETLADVQKAYWDLVVQWERVRLQGEILGQAKTLYDIHREKSEDGYVEVPDLLAAEANLKKRQNDLSLAQSSLKTKNNMLLLMLNQTGKNLTVQPIDTFESLKSIPDAQTSLKKAFELRRDYKIVHNNIKSKDIHLSMKKNNLWPEIDLTVTLANNGLGDHFSDSVKTITDESNPNYFLGLTITFPLENREARAELKEADLEKAKQLLQLKYLERQISVAVMDQVRVAKVLREVATNHDEIAQLQNQKLEEELKRFSRGRSDTDTVVRYQNDANESRLEAVQAKYNYYAALIDLKMDEASLLTEYWEDDL